MVTRILPFRPATVVRRLAPRSVACPLSGRELIGAATEIGVALPVVRAPTAGVARGALVAAKQLQAALGLALPPGIAAARWFDGVTRAADEIAAGLPIALCAEIAIEGEGATHLDRASAEAWRLADAGLTHLAFDVAAVAPEERGRVVGEVARAVFERGVGVEVIVPLGEPQGASRAAAMLEDAAGAGVAVDLASLRCAVPADDGEARLQAAVLARIAQGLGGVPIMRRGPVTPGLLELLRGSPVRACEDGGAVAESAGALVAAPVPVADQGEPDAGARAEASGSDRAADEPPGEAAELIEARAYVEATDFIERLGSRGSAPALARALLRRLVER